MDDQKGFDALILAFTPVVEKCPEWNFVVLRDGEELVRLETLIEESAIVERIHMPGRARNVRDRGERADLYALSSRGKGAPNTLLEAMAGSTAVVAADYLTGPPKLITPRVDGLLVPVDDEQALRSALHRLKADSPRRRELGQAPTGFRDRLSLERVGRQRESFCRIEATHGSRGSRVTTIGGKPV